MTSEIDSIGDGNVPLRLEIHPATEADFDLFMQPLFAVMGRSPFVSALWPKNQTELGRQQAKQRWLKEMESMPGKIHWMKVVNTEETDADGKSAKIVAVAQWVVYEPGMKCIEVASLMPEDHWENDTEKAWGTELWESYIGPRRAVLEKEKQHPVLNLQILCTWPQYWKHGAGGMLIKYGCDIADSLDAVCVVESSGMGEPVYGKSGFLVKKRFKLRARKDFGDRERGEIVFMIRPRKGKDDYSFPDSG